MTAAMRFDWWEQQDPATFLAANWEHPSRAMGTAWALEAVRRYNAERPAGRPAALLVEVGPGAGVDYSRAFRAVPGLRYIGWEPTARFIGALSQRFPDATWVQAAIADLPAGCAEVVYCRAVLEHQPALEPALAQLLAAARQVAVIDWYRPPADQPACDMIGGVHCHTFARAEVLAGLARANCQLAQSEHAGGNEVWLVRRFP